MNASTQTRAPRIHSLRSLLVATLVAALIGALPASHASPPVTVTFTTPSTTYDPVTGGTVSFTIDLTYSTATGFSPEHLSVLLPFGGGWSFQSIDFSTPGLAPFLPDNSGGSSFEWMFTDWPDNAATIDFTVAYVPGLSGNQTFMVDFTYDFGVGESAMLFPDNITLTPASAIPEPSTLPLCGGLLALSAAVALHARRNRVQSRFVA